MSFKLLCSLLFFPLVIVVLLTYLSLSDLSDKSNWLETAAHAATIVTGMAAFIGVASIIYQKWNDDVLDVVTQISFFRSEVLSSYEKVAAAIMEKDPDFDFKKLRTSDIEEFDYAWLYGNYFDQVKAQEVLVPKIIESALIIDFLNKMEEFSIRVWYRDTIKNPALNSVVDSYVEMVECLSHYILHQRLNRENTYIGIQNVYMDWKNKADRKTVEQKRQQLQEQTKKLISEGRTRDASKIIQNYHGTRVRNTEVDNEKSE